MKVLIVGLGYAGTRFRRAFESLWVAGSGVSGELAYVGRKQTCKDIPYYDAVPAAIADYQPDVVILSVNDIYRAAVSQELKNFSGFVICEKPFICPWDDLAETEKCFSSTSGFCLDLVERYSPISETLKEFVGTHELELLRANFTWGKDRLGDHRPTCGVTSEIIHSLDLIQQISGIRSPYHIAAVHGVRSDFSLSGPDVVDSVSVLGKLGDAVVSGYASFVNVSRRREIGFIFARRTGGLVFANTIFDDPVWDDDHLRIWEIEDSEESVLVDQHVVPAKSASGHMGIAKLVRLVSDVSAFIEGSAPCQPFSDLSTTIQLQNTLNLIHEKAVGSAETMSFSRHGRVPVMTDSANWERLG